MSSIVFRQTKSTYKQKDPSTDVTSEKHLNPLGSAVHGATVSCIALLFCITAVALRAYGDPQNDHINGAKGLAIFGMIVAFTFALNELRSTYRR